MLYSILLKQMTTMLGTMFHLGVEQCEIIRAREIGLKARIFQTQSVIWGWSCRTQCQRQFQPFNQVSDNTLSTFLEVYEQT